ncbi:hypothetical protein V6N13_082347 [Hibiscus sabdariffa]
MPDSIRWTAMFQNSGAIKNDVWKLVWANLAPPKVEFFVRKAVHNRLPTRVKLYTRGLVNIQYVVLKWSTQWLYSAPYCNPIALLRAQSFHDSLLHLLIGEKGFIG